MSESTDRPVFNPTKIKPRLTVLETVYHQTPSKQPHTVATTSVRICETHEQVYTRELIATEEWQPVVDKCCWLDSYSLIHVKNEAGTGLVANPSEKEQAAIDAQVLELSFSEDNVGSFHLGPGETFRGNPQGPNHLLIRSLSGDTDYTLTVFPR